MESQPTVTKSDCRPKFNSYPLVVRIPPDLVFVFAESVDDFEVDEHLAVIPVIRDVQLVLIGSDTVNEMRLVHSDRVRLRRQTDRHSRCKTEFLLK